MRLSYINAFESLLYFWIRVQCVCLYGHIDAFIEVQKIWVEKSKWKRAPRTCWTSAYYYFDVNAWNIFILFMYTYVCTLCVCVDIQVNGWNKWHMLFKCDVSESRVKTIYEGGERRVCSRGEKKNCGRNIGVAFFHAWTLLSSDDLCLLMWTTWKVHWKCGNGNRHTLAHTH